MVGTSSLVDPVSPPSDGPERPDLDTRVAVLKAVADPTRLLVLDALAASGSQCHCELEERLAVPANRLSFHLKVLRDAGLVRSTRRGRRVHYLLEPRCIEVLRQALP